MGTCAFEAVAFDMDGLMVDSELVWAAAWGPAFARYGLELYPGLVERCAGATQERIKRLVDELYGGNPLAVRAYEDHLVLAREELIAHGAPTKPGLASLLDDLAEREVPCAVASSSPRAVVEAVLEHAGVGARFAAVLTGDDGYASKPAPDIFLAAARRLGANPARTLVLEDSPAGVRAAAAGGMPCVMVPDLVPPTDELRGLCLAVRDSLEEVRALL